MGMGKKTAAALAAIAAAWQGAAFAADDIIDRVTADQLEAALEAAGLNPEMMVDADTGAPVARGEAGDIVFFVRGLECSGRPVACEDLVFFANFGLGRPVTARDYRLADDFKDKQVFGRAYVLEKTNEVGVDYVIELSGGVTEEHLATNISRWADVILAFIDKFTGDDAGA